MGAFDAEVAALGLLARSEPVSSKDPKELTPVCPKKGMHVRCFHGQKYQGIVLGVFDEIVVINLDDPIQDWGGTQNEFACRRKWTFYEVSK